MTDLSALTVYQLVICATLCWNLAVCIWNLVRLQTLGASGPLPTSGPLVSVLIPARNEERCIEACVRSVCMQSYADVEVLVLDDNSTDSTGEILRGLQAEFPGLTVMHGSTLPEGWVGKSWACHQLSEQAKGDILLFTDADTIHHSDSVAATVDFIAKEDVEFFSVIPNELMGSFGEHAVIPMVHVLFFCYVPNGIIHPSRRNTVASANGQFMCFTRTGYTKVGGHESVHNSMVEDLFLAKNAQRAGLRMTMVDATRLVACRMYENARQVTDGFSKNFFPATEYSVPFTLLLVVHVVTAFIVPVALWIDGHYILSVIPLAAAALIRLLIALRFGMPWWHMFLQPITAAWTAFIGLNSMRWAYSKRGVRWKNRSYQRP